MENSDERSAAACWARFQAAAAAARLGRYRLGHALIESIRARSGDYAAATARQELRRYCQMQDEAFDKQHAPAAYEPPGDSRQNPAGQQEHAHID
jgi:hypothetical protein